MRWLVFISAIFSLRCASLELDPIYNGVNFQTESLALIADQVKPGQVIFISEFHDVAKHHELQRQLIELLIERNFKVNVGLEHFSYLEQPALDAYLDKKLAESSLLKTVRISNFDSYRDQTLLPLKSGGRTYGLNAPRWLTGKINAVGLSLLSPLERQVLPIDFQLGRPEYKERFMQAMGMVHPSPSLDNIFAAQSAWDDTSAATLAELTTKEPQSVFVVLFGDFHIAYGGGLPNRFSSRSKVPWISISQFCVDGLSRDQIEKESKPDIKYGQRADYVVPTLCEGN